MFLFAFIVFMTADEFQIKWVMQKYESSAENWQE